MKKIAPFLTVSILVLIIVGIFLAIASHKEMIVVKNGNINQLPLKMEVGIYQDSDCGMVINDLTDASEVISPNGDTWFFHDHGDFIDWLKDKKFKNKVKIWVKTRDTKRWIDAKKAYYSLVDKTAMGYGFGAYEKQTNKYVDFDTMRIRMLRGETLKNLKIRKQLLGQ